MALPAHLQRYESMVDWIVEELVREVEAEMSGLHNESAPGVTTSEGANQLHQRHEHSPGGRSVVDHTRIPPPST